MECRILENTSLWSKQQRLNFIKRRLNELASKHDCSIDGCFVKLSNSKRFLGMCHGEYEGDILKTTGFEFSNIIFDNFSMDEIEDAIRHEFAHHYVDTINKCSCGHGLKWIEACKIIGCKPSATATENPIKPLKYKYTITCSNCGNVINRDRMSKDVYKNYNSYYRCGKCKKDKFKVVKNY